MHNNYASVQQQYSSQVRFRSTKTLRMLRTLVFLSVLILIFFIFIKKPVEPFKQQSLPTLNNPQINQIIKNQLQLENIEGKMLIPSLKSNFQESKISKKTVNVVDLLKIDSSGKRIEDYLYPEEKIRRERQKFYYERRRLVDKEMNKKSFRQINYNLKLSSFYDKQQKKVQSEQYQRLQKQYNLSQHKTELPMCLVAPSYNNAANYRIQYNLNSIFTQNYTNYFLVIINDASTDKSHQLYTEYFNFHNISKDKYIYLKNDVRKTAVQNYYEACLKYCRKDSVVVSIDGDDQLIGRNVLKVINWAYLKNGAGVVYSNYYEYHQESGKVKLGLTSQYSDEVKKLNIYRVQGQLFSHLRTFRNSLFHKLNPKDLKDKQNKFYRTAYDYVIYFPILELSCGRIYRLNQVQYLYNTQTGLNDYHLDMQNQANVGIIIRNRKGYNCSEEFLVEMGVK